MRILIIDNNRDPDCWGAMDLRVFTLKKQGATIDTRRGFHDDLPLCGPEYFDRTIVSGSAASCLTLEPWSEHLDQWVRRTVDLGKPLLGICYGHQVLCRSLGGLQTVRKSAIPQFGWTRIERTTQTPLFEGLPQIFYSMSTHYEEVSQLPHGMRVIARSQGCAIEACQVAERPVYGVQFHPEKTADAAELILKKAKKTGKPPQLLLEDTPRYYDPKVGEKIFENFLSD